MENKIELLDKQLLEAYEDVVKTSENLIQLQKQRINELEIEVTNKNEVIERLMVLLEETLEIAKTQANKNILPTLSAN